MWHVFRLVRAMRFAFVSVVLATAIASSLVGCRSEAEVDPHHQSELGQADARATHDVLFDTFLPQEALPSPDLEPARQQVREGMWQKLGTQPSFLQLIGATSSMMKGDSLEDHERALAAMSRSSSSDVLRLVSHLRLTYLTAIYDSPLGWRIANTQPIPVEHPKVDDFVARTSPALPEARISLDRSKKELVHRDGAIDYLIVGSGPAGSVLAHELRQGGKRVVVLERGSFVLPGAMETRIPSELRESMGLRTTADGGVFIRAASAVGGGTTINVDLAFAPTLPFIRDRIEGWRREGAVGPNQLEPEQIARAYEWVRTKVGVRTPSKGEINANNRILWDGATRHGYTPTLYDLNTYAPSASPSPVTDKKSAVSAFLLPAMVDSNNPLSVVPDADVQRVILESVGGTQRAVGVELRVAEGWNAPGVIKDPHRLGLPTGETITVHAKNVILSAGALGTAALLLKSKVKNPNIGTGVVLHPSMPLIGEFERPIDILEGTSSTVYSFRAKEGFAFESMSAEPAYGAAMIPGTGRQIAKLLSNFRHLGGFGVMLVDTVDQANRIVLDASGSPVVDYRISEEDKRRFRHGVGEAARVMFKAGARRVILPTTEDVSPAGGFLSRIEDVDAFEANLAFIPLRTTVTSAHMQATAKMGPDPKTSVVSLNHEVWGTRGLYVMDASVFPTSVGANPMQTIYTVAKIFADARNADSTR